MIYTTPDKFISAVKNVYSTAHNNNYKYGDSHAWPPTSDKIISCDRLIAKACYDLGWKDQPHPAGTTSGITVINMESYLVKWGWTKITDQSKLQKGDVVLFKWNGQTKPTAQWHTFVLTSYNHSTQRCGKYDTGSDTRIRTIQPYSNVPLNEWVGSRSFYCGFRCPQKPTSTTLTITTKTWNVGDFNSSYVKMAQKLLRGMGYKGKDGKVLELDGSAGANTQYALHKFQKDNGLSESDKCTLTTWRKLTGLTCKEI